MLQSNQKWYQSEGPMLCKIFLEVSITTTWLQVSALQSNVQFTNVRSLIKLVLYLKPFIHDTNNKIKEQPYS